MCGRRAADAAYKLPDEEAQTETRSPAPAKYWGIAFLVGYFLVFCAAVMLIAGGWRAYQRWIVDSRWIPVQAQVRNCSLDVDHPFTRDGGGVVYSLNCRLAFEIVSRRYESDLRTVSSYSTKVRDAITDWVAQSPPGSMLMARVNPSNPKELVVDSPLPARQYATASDAWITAAAFAIPGLLLVAIARKQTRVLGNVSRVMSTPDD